MVEFELVLSQNTGEITTLGLSRHDEPAGSWLAIGREERALVYRPLARASPLLVKDAESVWAYVVEFT